MPSSPCPFDGEPGSPCPLEGELSRPCTPGDDRSLIGLQQDGELVWLAVRWKTVT